MLTYGKSDMIMMMCTNNHNLLVDNKSNSCCSKLRANCFTSDESGKLFSMTTFSYILAFASAIMLFFVDAVDGNGSGRLVTVVTVFCRRCD